MPTSRDSGRDRPSIRDVAARAHVAPSTASNALNGAPQVGAETRRRILQAARDLGYAPNGAARSLRTGRFGAIAIRLAAGPSAGELATITYNARLASAASCAAFERNLALVLLPPYGDIDVTSHVGIDGAILVDPPPGDSTAPAFRSARVPIVTVEADPSHPDDPWWVGADTRANTRTILDHLASAGARRIAYLGVESGATWASTTTKSYLTWCSETGNRPCQVRMKPTADQAELSDAVGKLLAEPKRPDAVLALSERYAIAVEQAALRAGLRVPRDLRIASGSEGDRVAQAHPPITALDLHPDEVGHAAVELLVARINDAPVLRPRIVRATLRSRTSTARPAADQQASGVRGVHGQAT